MEIMSDPVMSADGFTYERSAIETWFRNSGSTPLSPLSGKALPNRHLIPNNALKSAIGDYAKRQEELRRRNLV